MPSGDRNLPYHLDDFSSTRLASGASFGQGVIPSRRMGAGQRTVLALRASGEEFPIEASISRTQTAGETVYTAILRDVTETVRFRQQIEQQAQMLDQVSDAVSVLDLQGRVTFWNEAAHRLFGWSAAEARERLTISEPMRD